MSLSQKRITGMLFGNLLLGIAIGVLRIAELGTDPFATMNLGVSSTLGLSFGFYSVLFNLLLFIFLFINSRELIGFGTFINMFLLGYTADLIVYLFQTMDIGEIGLGIRFLLLFVGVFISSTGLSLYVTANLGVSPYDALPLMMQEMTNNRIPFGIARLIVDATAVLIGYFFGAVVGVGTLVVAVSLGPLVSVFNKYWFEPILKPETLEK
ncbi:MAG: YczE/YyaS/YitT family protein [Bacillota bacterium]